MSDRLARILLIVVPAALWLACWPFVDMPVNDDFSYAFTVKRLFETGQFSYCGWSEGILGVQAFWALPFVYLFGFSHDVLRASMIPLSATCGLLAYGLYRKLGSDPRWSLFAALVLVSSPIFTPWSASFMTDVPGLVFVLLLLHVVVKLHQASNGGLALPLVLVATIGIAGGSIRQSLLALAGVALLFEAWRRRNQRQPLAAVIVCTILYAAIGGAMLAWASAQPYRIVVPLAPVNEWHYAARPILRLILDGVVYALPLIIALLPYGTFSLRRRLGTLAVVGIVAGTWFASGLTAEFFAAPWLGNSVTATGLLDESLDAGSRPVVFPPLAALALATLVGWTLVLGAQSFWRHRDVILALREANSPVGSVLVCFALMAMVYVAAMVPRAVPLHLFDRYLLVALPMVSAALLYAFRDRLSASRPGRAAWTLLAVFACVGVTFTFDHFAELRARAAFAAELQREGVPSNQISNGFSADGWQQLEAAGHLNDWRILHPLTAFDPSPEISDRAKIFWFLRFTPEIEPRWIIANVRGPEAVKPGTRAYRFRTLLRPRGRWIVAQPVEPSVLRKSDGR